MLSEKGLFQVKATSNASKINGQTVSTFTASPYLMSSTNGVITRTVMDRELTVLNTESSDVLNGSDYIVAKSFQGFHVRVGSEEDLREIPPMIRFRTTARIVDRVVAAVADQVFGLAFDVSNEPLVPGDAFDVHDPDNLFSNIEDNATGFAYFRKPVSSANNPLGSFAIAAQWEVLTCSLPIDEVLAEVDACLLATETEGTATIKTNGLWMRSHYPNVDQPPEVSAISGGGDFTVTFKNPLRLDAVEDSQVVLRRVTNIGSSEPENKTTPKARSVTQVEWQVVSVAKRKARFAMFTKASSTENIDSFYHGEDPELCGDPSMTNLFDDSCLKDGEKIIAFYDSNDDTYKGFASASAMLGTPDSINSVTAVSAVGCGLAFTVQPHRGFKCNAQPTSGTSTPTLTTVTVVTGAALSGDGLCFTRANVIVCGGEAAATTCITVGPCEPPEEPPCGTANYAWNDELQRWDLVLSECTSPCMSSAPPDVGTVDGQTATVNCFNDTPDPS